MANSHEFGYEFRCRLYSFDAGREWLVVTPDGLFDGSPGARRFVAYREPVTLKLVDDDATRKRFHRPGLLAQVWKGKGAWSVDVGNLTTGRSLLADDGHLGTINRLELSSDGVTIVTDGSDETIRLWHSPLTATISPDAQTVFNRGGDTWTGYRTAMFDHLQSSQNKHGSWPTSDGISVGPVYATALWCTILQLDKRSHPSRPHELYPVTTLMLIPPPGPRFAMTSVGEPEG